MVEGFSGYGFVCLGHESCGYSLFRMHWTHQFFMHSKSDVRGFFCLRFCLPWARILRLFPCFACTGHISFSCIPKVMLKVFRAAVLYALGTSPADVPLFRMHWTHLVFMHSKSDVRGFLWLRFCLPWARILRLFPCFACTGHISFLCIPKVTLEGFSACGFVCLGHESCCCSPVSHAVDTSVFLNFLYSYAFP